MDGYVTYGDVLVRLGEVRRHGGARSAGKALRRGGKGGAENELGGHGNYCRARL